MAKRWYYKDENGNKVPVPQYKINAEIGRASCRERV